MCHNNGISSLFFTYVLNRHIQPTRNIVPPTPIPLSATCSIGCHQVKHRVSCHFASSVCNIAGYNMALFYISFILVFSKWKQKCCLILREVEWPNLSSETGPKIYIDLLSHLVPKDKASDSPQKPSHKTSRGVLADSTEPEIYSRN